MTFGRPHLGAETDAAQIGCDELRGIATLIFVRGIRRDRLDAQQRKQAIETLVEIAIDPIEHGVEFTHHGLRRDACNLTIVPRRSKHVAKICASNQMVR